MFFSFLEKSGCLGPLDVAGGPGDVAGAPWDVSGAPWEAGAP
jgi:hypothetical protein